MGKLLLAGAGGTTGSGGAHPCRGPPASPPPHGCLSDSRRQGAWRRPLPGRGRLDGPGSVWGAPGAGLKERKAEMKATFGGWLSSAQEESAVLAPPPSDQGLTVAAAAESTHGVGEGAEGSLAESPCTPLMHCPILGASPRPVARSTQHLRRAGPRPAGRARPPLRAARSTRASHGLPSPCPPSRLCPVAAKPSSLHGEGAEPQPPPAPSSIYENTLLWKWDVQELSVQYKPTAATQSPAHRHSTTAPKAHLGGAVGAAGGMAPMSPWAWR